MCKAGIGEFDKKIQVKRVSDWSIESTIEN